MRYTTAQVGELIRDTRKRLGVTQKDLALTSGTGLRFIVDLEKGKETCELGKALAGSRGLIPCHDRSTSTSSIP
jgi:HTH-type transcriptional regulator / antitoxin HipB